MEPKKEIRVGVRELRGNLTRYLNQVRAGTSVLVTSRDIVVAEIHPPTQINRPSRRPGSMKGQIWMADDFDTWPEDILASFES